MNVSARAIRGSQAGALTAAAVEGSFFVLDLVRLTPLATPLALSGSGVGPAAGSPDLTGISGAFTLMWSAVQIAALTAAHFVAFMLVGLLVSLAFDWTRPTGLGRFLAVGGLCLAGFFIAVASSSSVLALESIGAGLVVGMNLLGAVLLCGVLRLVSTPDTD